MKNSKTKGGMVKACSCGESANIGAIYKQVKKKGDAYYRIHVHYFICEKCFDYTAHMHDLSVNTTSPTHLHGDISGNDHQWMENCRTITRDGIYPLL